MGASLAGLVIRYTIGVAPVNQRGRLDGWRDCVVISFLSVAMVRFLWTVRVPEKNLSKKSLVGPQQEMGSSSEP